MQTTTNQPTQEPNQLTTDQPLPLSFPSILINPRLKHLNTSSPKLLPATHHSHSHNPNNPHLTPIGRRRTQRFENAQFTSNPHVCRPEAQDYQLWRSNLQIRFPIRPPRGYPSSMFIPPAERIPVDPFSATMGAFNRSLKGVRKSIRPLIRDHHQSHHNPGPVEETIIRIDNHLFTWIDSHTIWKSTDTDHSHRIIDPNPWPPASSDTTRDHSVLLPHEQPSIVEISRSPYMLKWDVPSPFGRYLVHCIARYYGIVSFSSQRSIIHPAQSPTNNRHSDQNNPNGPEDRRIVCMVKAHFPTSRGPRRIDGNQTLDTPPTTDLDSELSAVEVASEADSIPTTDDDHTDPIHPPKKCLLSSIEEKREMNEHETSDCDPAEPFTKLVTVDSDHHHSPVESLDKDDFTQKGKTSEWCPQQPMVMENSEVNVTPPMISTPSKGSPSKSASISNKSPQSVVPQDIQPKPSPLIGVRNDPPFETLPQRQYNSKKTQVVVAFRSEKPVNFLDWVRGN